MRAKIDVEVVYPLDVTWEEWEGLSQEEQDILTKRVGEMFNQTIVSEFVAGNAWVMFYGEPDNVIRMLTDREKAWLSEEIEAFCEDINRVAYHFARAPILG